MLARLLPSPRTFAWFSVRSFLAFALLILPWPGLAKTYGRVLTVLGNATLSLVGLDDDLFLRKQRGVWIRVLVLDEDGSKHLAFSFNSYWTGFVALAIVLALVVGWRQPLGDRVRSALLGGLLVHGYVLFRIGLMTLHSMTLHDVECARRHAALFEDERWQGTIEELVELFHIQPTTYALVPFASWSLAQFILSRRRGARGSAVIGEPS